MKVRVSYSPKRSHTSPGDRVLLNWAMPCDNCFQCRPGAANICETKSSVPAEPFTHNGKHITTAFDLGTMGTRTVVPWQGVVKTNVDIPFPSAAILGCAVMTGWGSIVARVEKGSSIVVLGCGGVGLSVIQGAVHNCALKIIAVELNQHRLELATQFSATHTILVTREDTGLRNAAKKVLEFTTRRADYAFECTAVPALGPRH